MDVFVYSGESANFGCDCYEEDQGIPSWTINGAIYPITRLPRAYYFDFETSSLKILEVSSSMNLSTHQCYLGSDSSIGTLYIKRGTLY